MCIPNLQISQGVAEMLARRAKPRISPIGGGRYACGAVDYRSAGGPVFYKPVGEGATPLAAYESWRKKLKGAK